MDAITNLEQECRNIDIKEIKSSLRFWEIQRNECCAVLTHYQMSNFRLSKLKEFADDIFKFDKNGRKLSKQVENTVGKGEIARYKQFLLFPQCFQKACFPEASKDVIVWEWVNREGLQLLKKRPKTASNENDVFFKKLSFYLAILDKNCFHIFKERNINPHKKDRI